MKYAKVNTNYEIELFKDVAPHAGKKPRPEHKQRWEFIFFFLNQDPQIGLCTEKSYTEDYLSFLKELGLKIPQFTKNEPDFFWFGALKNMELERKLNSKVWTYNLLESLGHAIPDLHMVKNREEAEKIIEGSSPQTWFLKSPFRCSGSRMSIVETASELPEIDHIHILEPFRERVIDLVYHYNPETCEGFAYISKPSREGKYRGGMIFSRQEELLGHIKELGYEQPFAELKEKWEDIMKELVKEDLKQPLTIDSFLYKDGDQVKAYAMCEINYRVNIGTFLDSLKRFIPPTGIGELIVIKKPRDADLRKYFSYNREVKTGILCLTDSVGDTAALFLCGPNTKAILKLKRLAHEVLTGLPI